jgi:hypothetical protein
MVVAAAGAGVFVIAALVVSLIIWAPWSDSSTGASKSAPAGPTTVAVYLDPTQPAPVSTLLNEIRSDPDVMSVTVAPRSTWIVRVRDAAAGQRLVRKLTGRPGVRLARAETLSQTP